MTITIRPASPQDFDQWLTLWEGYNRFYERHITDDVTHTTWARLLGDIEPMHVLVAEQSSSLVGFVHYLFHRSTGTIEPNCYLQDLFTAPATRGQGVGGALIEAVYDAAREAGAARVYWLTHESNETARKLYDRIADNSGFLVYRKMM